MKRTLTKSMRSLLALLLVGCMMFGLCGAAVATETSTADRVGNLLKELEDLLEEYGPKVLEEIYTYYDADTAELKAQAKALAAMLEEKLESYTAERKEAIDAAIDELEADLKERRAYMQGQVDDLNVEMAAMEALLATAEGEEVEAAKAAIAEINAEIAVYQSALDSAVNVAETKIAEMREGLVDLFMDVENLRSTAKQLKKAIEDAENFDAGTYDDAIEAAVAALKSALKEIHNQIQGVENGATAFDAALQACLAVMQGLVNEGKNYVDYLYASVTNTLDIIKEKLRVLEAPVAGFNAHVGNAQLIVGELIADRENVAKDLYKKAVKLANELAEELSVLYGPIKEKVKEYAEKFYAAYERATTDDYHITRDSYYVAVGDDSAVSESYVDALAAYLEVDYNNLAQEELTTKEAVAFVKANEAEIQKADLITVGFSSAAVMVKALDHSGALDWATYVGEEGAVKVKQVLAKISDELAGSSQELADAVESYAYYCLSYAVHLPELVNEIRQMNPDAVIAIVGMYNELENVSITMDGKELPVGDYFHYMIEASSMYGLVYAMLTSNAIFVEVENAEVVNTKTPLTPVQLVVAYAKGNMYPSEAGHEKIKQDVIDALRITREPDGLLGDADDNGVVNVIDAMLVAQYANGLNPEDLTRLDLCYLNHDEEVNILDAMLIAQYANEAIDKFPVEE